MKVGGGVDRWVTNVKLLRSPRHARGERADGNWSCFPRMHFGEMYLGRRIPGRRRNAAVESSVHLRASRLCEDKLAVKHERD